MYRPSPNSPVTWVWQDGSPAITTTFTDTGDIDHWTPAKMIARYGNPVAVLDTSAAAQFLSADEIARLRANPVALVGYLRFPLDPAKPNLQGFVREAALHGAKFLSPDGVGLNITEESNPARSFQQAQDIAATLLPQGEHTPLFQQYLPPGAVGAWPNRPGDSTDPAHPTTRKINGPHGPFSRVGMDGRTYYYFNPLGAPNTPSSATGGTVAGTSGTAPSAAGPSLKEAVDRLRRALPAPGKGGAPLQALAEEVRKFLALIEAGK